MTLETVTILRAILFSALRTNNVTEIRAAIMAMCSGDDITFVKEQIAKMEAELAKEGANGE